MTTSFNSKILHVDLSFEKTWIEEPSDNIYRTYLGGSALSAYFLLREMKPGLDPLGPDNILVFMTSVINGLPMGGVNRYNAAAKSPLTGGIADSQAGGYWGPMLKRAGFDGIVIHGKAERPVYLLIKDDTCEIRDASHFWGKLSDQVQEGLEEETGDKRTCVLQTGVAGENGVLYAALTNQMRHFHGRTGLGAVMGSKNLKAIAVIGRKKLALHDKDAGDQVLQWYRETYNPKEDLKHAYGTSRIVPWLNRDGILPTHNFREGYFEHADAISGQVMADTILKKRNTCFACPVACKRMVEIPEKGIETKYGGMEYETIAAVGSLCGVGVMAAVAEANQWINRYVLDSISTGTTIAFAMECYENGILTRNDTDGLDLSWGNSEAVIQLIHKIARREGIGDLLANGVKRAAEQIGQGAEQYAMHVKGQEFPMHEPRGKVGVGLAYATSPTGADHMQAPHDAYFMTWGEPNHPFTCLGLHDPVDVLDLSSNKVRAYYYMQTVFGLFNSIGICDLVGSPIGTLNLEKLKNLINAATGWDMSIFEMMKVGERATTLARYFNAREGFTARDDTLPDRMFQPLQNGTLKGQAIDRKEFERALDIYYTMLGWENDGNPAEAKLAELGVFEIA